MKIRSVVPVVIVGAGPYGLAIGAHLHHLGVSFRLFGHLMHTWRERMPAGMLLKSEGYASSLHAPVPESTLKEFCRDQGLAYADVGVPVPLDTFVKYAVCFQQRFVPELEEVSVQRIEWTGSDFNFELENGESVVARRVVLATGITHFQHRPEMLASLPCAYATHSSEHRDVSRFAGRHVTVLGGGASALDLAGALAAAGANVEILTRKSEIRWGTPPDLRESLWQRVRYPRSRLGTGWRLRLCASPAIFRLLPAHSRRQLVSSVLGPAGGWATKDKVDGRVPIRLGSTVCGATVERERVRLCVAEGDGSHSELMTDHVIAATGYRVDLDRLRFLSPLVRRSVGLWNHMPALSPRFESTLPGLYFVGLPATTSFGPAMRFVAGAEYAACALGRHLREVSQ